MKLKATLKSSNTTEKVIDFRTLEAPLSLALSRVMESAIYSFKSNLEQKVLGTFYFPQKPSSLGDITLKRAGNTKQIFSAVLTYKYKAVRLSAYPVQQVRVTTGKRKLLVVRGKPFKLKDSRTGFDTSFTNEAIATYTQIRKSGGKVLVRGKLGKFIGKPMGFLHTGKKKSIIGRPSFPAQIFERNQEATWADGERLPIHALYAPSFTDLLKSPEIEKYFTESPSFNKILEIMQKEAIKW